MTQTANETQTSLFLCVSHTHTHTHSHTQASSLINLFIHTHTCTHKHMHVYAKRRETPAPALVWANVRIRAVKVGTVWWATVLYPVVVLCLIVKRHQNTTRSCAKLFSWVRGLISLAFPDSSFCLLWLPGVGYRDFLQHGCMFYHVPLSVWLASVGHQAWTKKSQWLCLWWFPAWLLFCTPSSLSRFVCDIVLRFSPYSVTLTDGAACYDTAGRRGIQYCLQT